MAEALKGLVESVCAGNLSDAGPLADYLAEKGDGRAAALDGLLRRLTRRARDIQARFSPVGVETSRRLRRSSPEELAFHRDEECFRVWVGFTRELARLFTTELDGPVHPDLFVMADTTLNPVKQARRVARQREEGAEADVGMPEDIEPTQDVAMKESW